MSERILTTGFVALVMLVAQLGTAVGNVAAPTVELALGADPTVTADTPLTVDAETLALRCGGSPDAPSCAFEAVYTLRNPTTEVQTLTAAFYGIKTRVEAVALAGVTLTVRPMTDAEAASARLPDLQNLSPMDPELLERTAFDLTVSPESTAELVVTGHIDGGSIVYHSYGMSAAEVRHLFLGTRDPQNHFAFHYLVEPIRTWGGKAPTIDFSLTTPADWWVDTRLQTQSPPTSPVFSTTRAEDQTRTIARLDGENVHAITVYADTPNDHLNHGGVLLGVGGRVDDSGGFRSRLGYEVSYPDWLMVGLAADTDFTDELAVAAMAEAVSPGVFVIPSLGAGLGPVVQLQPDTEAGVRAQLTVQWPLLGFVTSFDVYPGMSTDDPHMFQVTMLAQIGL